MTVIPSLAALRRLRVEDLNTVADDLRTALIRSVATTGGHFGSSLGVVELTVALHHVYDTPRDRLIWDVGHQAYPHKMLTGRLDRMPTMRQSGGLSGFTRRAESEFDPFGAAHSSTSISAAFGMAVARDLAGGDHHVVAVIGDGALSAGLAFEGLNNAGASMSRLVVVLNDNEMSIAPPTGALAAHLQRLDPAESIDPGRNLFSDLGFDYRGPIDGHDLAALVPALAAARAAQSGPVLVHVVTQKGKGYAPAECAADRGHSTNPFDHATGQVYAQASTAASYTDVFAAGLIEAARHDDRIVAITAAMPSGTGLDRFAAAFPSRCFDVGIAEQHAVTFAAGLAAEGFKPFVAIYSTFLQRAYDQVVHDVAIQKLPVRFCLDRAGLVGPDGPTHAGAFDLAYLCCLPDFVVMAPSDGAELAAMVASAAAYDEGPIALRYPRGSCGAAPTGAPPLPIGKGRLLRQGHDLAIVCLGARLTECLAAADLLAREGYSVSVADARFAKPLDAALLLALADTHQAMLTVEDGAMGGFGAQVQNLFAERRIGPPLLRSLCLPDRFLGHGRPDELYAQAGLDRHGIATAARRALADDRRTERVATAW